MVEGVRYTTHDCVIPKEQWKVSIGDRFGSGDGI